MRVCRILPVAIVSSFVLAPAILAQSQAVSLLNPSAGQGAPGVTLDTSRPGIVGITHAGITGILSARFPAAIEVIPCTSGVGSCLAPATLTVEHTIRGMRQVSIIVNSFCIGPVSGFGFVDERFNCPLSGVRLDEQNQVFAQAFVTLQSSAASQGPLFEYACHEGNRGLANILAGARAAEREGGGSSR